MPWTSGVVEWLLLWLLVFQARQTQTEIMTRFEDFSAINNTFCTWRSGLNIKYNEYTSALVVNQTFDNISKRWTMEMWERCDVYNKNSDCNDYNYNFESTRFLRGSMCTYCPYHLDPSNVSLIDQSSYFEDNKPMFGPCLNGLASKRMPCLQHYAFAPQKFVGKYYYSLQRALPQSIIDTPFPIHQFLSNSITSTPYETTNNGTRNNREPTLYGLGKGAVTGWLETLVFQYDNGTIHAAATADLQRPYTTVNGVEQWMKYAQFFCEPGCHKYDKASSLRIRAVDIDGDDELGYLRYYQKQGQPVFACRPCPQFSASYDWDYVNSKPFDPRLNIRALECNPWFGAIPSMIYQLDLNDYTMNTTEIKNNALSKVEYPTTEYEVFPLVCPVNTFNRICAHAKERYYLRAMAASAPNRKTEMEKYNCTPCPAGYHTAGRQGQWYCSPPVGRVFVYRDQLSKNPNLWGDRDFMSYMRLPELECGYQANHCYQCADSGYGAANFLPHDFNEKHVFRILLEEKNCSSGSYCPDAFSIISCPSVRPWSPPGSGFDSNCTCARGTYWNETLGVCLPCTSDCTNKRGYYLPRSQCMEKDGATQDAPCTWCTNIPKEWAEAENDLGVEIRPGEGACPFRCTFGSTIDMSKKVLSDKSNCEQTYACNSPRPRLNNGGQYMYKERSQIMIDGIGLVLRGSSYVCEEITGFTSQVNNINNPSPLQGWLTQPTTCLGEPFCLATENVCYAENQIAPLVDASRPWYSFSARVNCTPCPGLQGIPPGASLRESDVLLGSTLCQNPKLICNTTHYFNQTAWACQSCLARQNAICPINTILRGGGCMRSYAPFNLTVPSADCQLCPLTVPDFNASKGRMYLNYANQSLAAEGGCSIDACANLRNGYFWRTACGADNSGEQRSCGGDCLGYQYRASECSAYADRVCKNCTVSKPGFIKEANCSTSSDSQWRECRNGYFCDSSGIEAACPANKTSIAGATSAVECFCKAGMTQATTGGGCDPYECEGTILSTSIPGKSRVSSHYMTIDVKRRATQCLPCNTQGAAAFTRGDGVEIESCVCPPGFYGMYANESKLSIQCTACPTSSYCSPGSLLPSCAEGDIKALPPSEPFPCPCTKTPFIAASCGVSGPCSEGFEPNQMGVSRSPVRGLPQISGSSLYAVNKSNAARPRGWNRFLETTDLDTNPTSINYNIQAFAITGCVDDSILANAVGMGGSIQATHFEYIFWIVSNTLTVYAARLQTDRSVNLGDLALKDYFSSSQSFAEPRKLLGIAVSKWRVIDPNQAYNSGNRDSSLYVAALVKDTALSPFYIKVHVFNVYDSNAIGAPGVWGTQNGGYILNLFQTPSPSQTPYHVGVVHCTKKMGDSAPAAQEGYFYVAFNLAQGSDSTASLSCGGIIVTNATSSANIWTMNRFCDPSSGAVITAMAVGVTQANPSILIALSSGLVLRIESESDSPPFTSIFRTESSSWVINNIFVLFSRITPVYIAGVHSESACSASYGFNCIKTADTSEMAWVDLEGMPWGSAVNSLPMSLGASVITNSEALLVVSSGNSLFTLSLKRCFSLSDRNAAQYWDGAGCTAHGCVKITPCAMNMLRKENGDCVCMPGYSLQSNGASSSCMRCNTPSYCEEGILKSCPDSTQTMVEGATSINDCVCPSSGNFFSPVVSQGPKCTNCEIGRGWCPNRWLKLPCPGSNKVWPPTLPNPNPKILEAPVHCLCAPGFTGPGCILCPSGFICPDTGTATATNLAVYYIFDRLPLTDRVVGFIGDFFRGYFANSKISPPNYNSDDLSRILFTQEVPLTNSTKFGIMVMIQIETTGTTAPAAAFTTGWPGGLFSYLQNKRINVTSKVPASDIAYSSAVPFNKPQTCMISKVPNEFFSSCICAPGYETKALQCSPCAVNTFKSAAGAGTCLPCAVGKVSAIKSSECILDPSLATDATKSSTGPDITLLAGGVGGGVAGLVLLIFVMQYFFKHTHKD